MIDNIKPGNAWGTLKVGVFNGDTQIGEYARNYPCLLTTFFPFKSGDRWLALYSRHYTATRVMSLPDCTDLGGEEPDAHGFCPMEYLVPQLCGEVLDPADPQPMVANHDADRWALKVPLGSSHTRYYWPDADDHPSPDPTLKAAYLAEKAKSHKLSDEWRERNPIVTRFAPYGLVGGCVWGDDSSVKVQFLDLSRAAEGVLVRDDRFGYLELPAGVGLAAACDFDRTDVINAPVAEHVMRIAVPVTYHMNGKRANP